MRPLLSNFISTNINMFKSYPKIPDHIKQSTTNCDWCVTEKIHGANMCCIYDGVAIQYAKRTRILNKTDHAFYGFCESYQLMDMLEQVGRKVMQIYNMLPIKYPIIYVYGELFGRSGTDRPIQRGVYYSPDPHFCAFDIAYQDVDEIVYYIPYRDAVQLFKQVELFYAIPLFIGSLNKCTDYNPKFSTTIPKLLDIQVPKDAALLAEGIVIKPYTTGGNINSRPVFKIKIQEFAEDKRPTGKDQPKNSTLDFMTQMAGYKINEQRMDSVLSKTGDQADTQYIRRMMLDDIIDELKEEMPYEITQLGKEGYDQWIYTIEQQILQFMVETRDCIH